MNPRLFLALRPPPEVREGLLAIMGGVAGARWQDDAQLHLTLRYLGEVDIDVAEDLVDAFVHLRFAPLDIALTGTGCFERKGITHTLWAGVFPSPQLLALQSRAERCCIRAGLPPETRKYAPHVTLARLNATSGPVAPFCARTMGQSLGAWRADSYILYESHLHPGGSQYELVRVYRATE
ncbi:RNA 2',3'-cyclic phosphodiesterase [Qipengyuania marisflavi]|uniref:RNA 2',3'-cyclic phosphodiesterase n=1 Tax=Qipengyuania marisflavi TaxID=2486356 RepID=A0A5S3P9R4_9SPHN|nr:RNA 2',3'-cyclic phosphodiesterase [Qipengyuania marisflavi]TMM50201.1 RNA 2',3'-cyclic phosphodiesterase [Qipengyuania marisflavi]